MHTKLIEDDTFVSFIKENNIVRNKINTLIVTKVSLGPCNKDDTSKADFPVTSTPLTAITSSPWKKISSFIKTCHSTFDHLIIQMILMDMAALRKKKIKWTYI